MYKQMSIYDAAQEYINNKLLSLFIPLGGKNYIENNLNRIEQAKQEGGTVLCGGERLILEGDLETGFYIAPTIINNGSYCSGFANFEIWLGGDNKNSAGVKYFGKEVSYNKGYIFTSSINRFKNGYLEVINDLTKSFIVAWKEIN